MSERPWFKFFPADWRADPALRMVSLGARALWIEMLCVMHDGTPRGFLTVKGKEVSTRQLAIQAGCLIDEAETFLAELEEAEVFSRSSAGVIFSRKMARESVFSEAQTKKVKSRWDRTNTENVEQNDQRSCPDDTKEHTEPIPIFQKLEPERISDANASSLVSAEPKPSSAVRIDEVRTAFDAWNALAKRLGLPSARNLDEGRRKAIRCRLADGGLAAWSEALRAVEASPHCRGENDRTWRADLDFVCQPKSWRRLLEGSYGGAPVAPAAVQPWSAEKWSAALDLHVETGRWGDRLGPLPGQPGCRAPPDVLAAHGYPTESNHAA